MADHPLPAMLEAGLKVSVHSDDPAYFGGYMDANFASLIQTFNFSTEQLAQLARNSFESSFIDDSAKRERLAEVDAWVNQR